MKKRTRLLPLNILLITGILLNANPILALANSDTDIGSQFDTITRVYDGANDGLLRYHYEDDEGNTISLENNTQTNTKNNSRSAKKATTIPSSYDLRNDGLVTPIKDQGVTGSCWAFGAIKSMESSNIIQGLQTLTDADLSENHLNWYTYHPSTDTTDSLYNEGMTLSRYRRTYATESGDTGAYMTGGSALLAEFILARGSGAVTENTAPFSASTVAEMNAMASSMTTTNATLNYSKNYALQNATCYDGATLDEIKSALMKKGAMDVAFYYDSNYDTTTSTGGTSYYQEKYSDSTIHQSDVSATDYANHCVTIVGWDDNYSKDNFGTYKPASDGAWLIANSYGTEYGDDGYFWISYAEPSLTEFYTFESTNTNSYDNNYQYDGFGWGNAIALKNTNTTTASNIYTANTSYNQSLHSVGIYTLEANQPYKIDVYRNVTGSTPTSGTLAASYSGTQEYAGYHTISLDSPVTLNGGEKFSVVIHYSATSTTSGYLPLEGDSYSDSLCNFNYTSNAGESFIYYNNTWIDLSTDGYDDITNNICLKAFTTNTSVATNSGDTNSGDNTDSSGNSNTGSSSTNTDSSNTSDSSDDSIFFDKSTITLGKKETYKLDDILFYDEDESVTYKSSKTSIATVNSNGKITAKKVGSTTITAQLSTGKTATLKVKVKKAPSKISLTPSSKKTIRIGKTLKLKTTLSTNSASNKLTFTTSNKKIVTVSSNGRIKAKKRGTSIITVKTYNKKRASIKITVK